MDTFIDTSTTSSAVFNRNPGHDIQPPSLLVLLLLLICGLVVLICISLVMGYKMYIGNKQHVVDDVANMRTLSSSNDIPQNTAHAPVMIPIMSTYDDKSTRNLQLPHDGPVEIQECSANYATCTQCGDKLKR
eukprot:700337_1